MDPHIAARISSGDGRGRMGRGGDSGRTVCSRYRPVRESPRRGTPLGELRVRQHRALVRRRWRGNVVPRLFLRRFLIPHFNLTFSTRDSIEIEPREFELFLLNPKAFEQMLRLKNVEDASKYDKGLADRANQMLLKLAEDDEPKS